MIPLFCAPEHRARLLGARERPFTIRADCLTDEHWEAVQGLIHPKNAGSGLHHSVCLRNFSSCTLSSGPPDKSLFEETACEHTPNYSHLAQSVHFRKKENDGQWVDRGSRVSDQGGLSNSPRLWAPPSNVCALPNHQVRSPDKRVPHPTHHALQLCVCHGSSYYY